MLSWPKIDRKFCEIVVGELIAKIWHVESLGPRLKALIEKSGIRTLLRTDSARFGKPERLKIRKKIELTQVYQNK